MKKATLGLIIISCVFSALVYAGPEQYSGKEMKQVAPAPVPACFNWAGFYVGGLGGYKRSNVDLGLDLSGGWDTDPDAKATTKQRGSGDLDNDGAEAGGLIGYNWQFNCWVIGLEASGGYLWARDSSDTGIFPPGSGVAPLYITSSFKTHYLATFAPRFGYAFGRFLPYFTGGLALGDLDYSQALIFPNSGGDNEGGSKTETNAGWFVGGGLQYALTDHWSVRGQYQYIDLGSVSFVSDFPNGGGAPAHHEASLTEHNFSAAIIFKF